MNQAETNDFAICRDVLNGMVAVVELNELLQHPEQEGGASLVVDKVTQEKSSDQKFKRFVQSVKLNVRIPAQMAADPQSDDYFGDAVVKLIKRYAPPTFKNTARVGVAFEFDDGAQTSGLPLTTMSSVKTADIVGNLKKMGQSERSPLNLNNSKVSIRITYVKPPSGSGRKRLLFGIDRILELDTFRGVPSKRARKTTTTKSSRRDGSLLDDAASEVDGEEEEEVVDDDDVTDGSERCSSKSKRGCKSSGNVMRNDVENNCLPHALFQAQMYIESRDDASKKQVYRRTLRVGRASGPANDVFAGVEKLKKKAGVTKTRDFTFDDIKQFQETVYAGVYQIWAFRKGSPYPFFKGSEYLGEDRRLIILLDEEKQHYHGVQKLCPLLGTWYYCGLCNVRYGSAGTHYNCPLLHRLCGKADCPRKEDGVEIECSDCRIVFRSVRCYDNHKMKGEQGGKSRCGHTKYCEKCETSYYTNKSKGEGRHVCGARWCGRCREQKEPGHYCVMTAAEKNEEKLTRKRIYFDIESREDEETGRQVPVLFVALRCCDECSKEIPKSMSAALEATCSNCSKGGRRGKVIENVSPDGRDCEIASLFTDWLFQSEHEGFTLIAHNGSGYDGQFILQNLIQSNKEAPYIILDGRKLVFLQLNGIRLIDSLKFLTMSLAKVGEAFKVDSLKGDFPVGFIRPENYDYSGPLPANEYYCLEGKSVQLKSKMEAHLEEERALGRTFNFKEELFKYCYNDVYILASAFSTFETAFEEMTDVCLVEESMTAASAAMMTYRRRHLPQNGSIVLDSQPSAAIQNSIISQKYLAWIIHKEKVNLRMSTTSGEEKIHGRRVDGFIPPCEKYPRGKIIEFYGCYWHGHSCKYRAEQFIKNRAVSDIREEDAVREIYLSQFHDVEIVWECDVEKSLNADPEMREFFDTYDPVGILEMDRALAGGRTEVFSLYMKLGDGETAHYEDVVSLYPTVMKTESFPTGPPSNVDRATLTLPMTRAEHVSFRGVIGCRILAPPQLRLPVLPVKLCGKLIFALCRQCTIDKNQETCRHTEKERSFHGTFTTVELCKALEKGYKVLEFYHGIKWDTWIQNDENGEGGMFTSYINQMMVEKIYSSGWPQNVETDDQKAAYCQAYYEKEGIRLDDWSRFEKNPGKRMVSKILLNSLWGKLAQRVDRPTTAIIVNPEKFWELYNDSSVLIDDIHPVNDTLVVTYRKAAESLESLKTNAVHIAAHVTSYARLRLYKFMEAVGPDHIMYTDTDSIMYRLPAGVSSPLAPFHGPYLGQLTNELEGEMIEFVTVGPKSYCYRERMADGEVKVTRKAKGITINSQVNDKLTFELMKRMVQAVMEADPVAPVVGMPQLNVWRDVDHNVYFRKIHKDFRFTFAKRRILADGSTLPFGYIES